MSVTGGTNQHRLLCTIGLLCHDLPRNDSGNESFAVSALTLERGIGVVPPCVPRQFGCPLDLRSAGASIEVGRRGCQRDDKRGLLHEGGEKEMGGVES